MAPAKIVYTRESTGKDKRLWESLRGSQGFKAMVEEYETRWCPNEGRGGYDHFRSYAENFRLFLGNFNPANFQVGGFHWEADPQIKGRTHFTIINPATFASITALSTVSDVLNWPTLKTIGRNGFTSPAIPSVQLPYTNYRTPSIPAHTFATPIIQEFHYDEETCCKRGH